MEWTTIYVSSVTNAMRGKRVLERQGYTVYMQRSAATKADNGCGYVLLVRERGGQAVERLRAAGVRVVRSEGGGGPR